MYTSSKFLGIWFHVFLDTETLFKQMLANAINTKTKAHTTLASQ